MSLIVRSWFLGRIDYNRALQLQKRLVDINCRPENRCPAHTILMLEHNPVYTVGIRSNSYTREQQQELQKAGAEFIRITRGGLITYHGPGQLMAYPIINLRDPHLAGKGLRWYVNVLERSGFEVCREIQPNAFAMGSVLFPELTAATGVWLDKYHKIMSIGVHRTRDVTYHGVGLNCSMEPLTWFEKIAPCGLTDCKMTSLESVTGDKISCASVAPKLSERLFANLLSHRNESLECTYSDCLADDKSLPWEKVVQFILKDADFRTKMPPKESEVPA